MNLHVEGSGGIDKLLQLRLRAVGRGGFQGGARLVILHPVKGKGEVAAWVVGVGLYLQAYESISAKFGVPNKRGRSTRQDGGYIHVLIAAFDIKLGKSGGDELLHGDQGGLRSKSAVGAGILFQGSALLGAGSELCLAAGHALRQLFLVLFLLGHASKIPAY